MKLNELFNEEQELDELRLPFMKEKPKGLWAKSISELQDMLDHPFAAATKPRIQKVLAAKKQGKTSFAEAKKPTKKELLRRWMQGGMTDPELTKQVKKAYPKPVSKQEVRDLMNKFKTESVNDKITAYHGSGMEFDKFDNEFAVGTQHWFTDNKQKIIDGEVGAGTSGFIYTVLLDIKNPAGWDEYDKFGIDELIGRGYDGLALNDGDQTTYVAFDADQIEIVDKELTEAKEDKLELPDLEVGDELMVGKFKNRKAEIKGFDKDKHNQPIAKTDKGDQQIFKGRVKKIMPEPK